MAMWRLQRQQWFRLGLGLVISLVTIYLAFKGVDLASVGQSLREASLLFVGLALGSVVINNVAKAARWKVLLGERGAPISLWQALRLHLVGQMINNLLPARVGDVSRVYLAGELGVSRSFVLGTVALEKVVDMLCYAMIFVLLVLLMPLPAWVSQPAYLMLVVTGLALVAVLAGLVAYRRGLPLPAWVLRWLPRRFQDRADAMLAHLLASLHVLTDARGRWQILFWSTVVWITATLTNYLVLRALAIDVPLVASLFVLFVLMAGINVPSAPGRIGLFQYLCILSLALFGVEQAPALSFGVLLHVLTFLPPIIAGLFALWLNLQGKKVRPSTVKQPETLPKQ